MGISLAGVMLREMLGALASLAGSLPADAFVMSGSVAALARSIRTVSLNVPDPSAGLTDNDSWISALSFAVAVQLAILALHCTLSTLPAHLPSRSPEQYTRAFHARSTCVSCT
jgi:hypothetical protein